MIQENTRPPFGVIVGGVISLVLFLFLAVSILYFYLNNPTQPLYSDTNEGVTVYDLLASPSKYSGQPVWVTGRVDTADVFCQNQTCPVVDPYCGCPDDQDLRLLDAKRVVRSSGFFQLSLVDKDGLPYCRRQENDRVYDCQGWVRGGNYRIGGVFMTVNPSIGTGTRFGLEYQIMVQEKEYLGQTNIFTTLTSYINDLSAGIKDWARSSGYIVK